MKTEVDTVYVQSTDTVFLSSCSTGCKDTVWTNDIGIGIDPNTILYEIEIFRSTCLATRDYSTVSFYVDGDIPYTIEFLLYKDAYLIGSSTMFTEQDNARLNTAYFYKKGFNSIRFRIVNNTNERLDFYLHNIQVNVQ